MDRPARPGPLVEVTTKYGRIKKIPKAHLWHHKSCGQCGHIPGYSTSIFWVMRKLGLRLQRPPRPDVVHGLELLRLGHLQRRRPGRRRHAELRRRLRVGLLPAHPLRHLLRPLQGGPGGADAPRRAAGPGARDHGQAGQADGHAGGDRPLLRVVLRHAPRDRRAADGDFSGIAATVHPACHYYKLVEGDAIYDADVYGGQRTAVVTGRGRGARRRGPQLLDVVRLLRLRLPAHPRPARLHPSASPRCARSSG